MGCLKRNYTELFLHHDSLPVTTAVNISYPAAFLEKSNVVYQEVKGFVRFNNIGNM